MSITEPLSQQQIIDLLTAEGIALKKRWGQNFLLDHGLCRQLVGMAGTFDGALASSIWEIGPGLGALTHWLLEIPGRHVFFEIDHGLTRILERRYPQLAPRQFQRNTADEIVAELARAPSPHSTHPLLVGDARHALPAALDAFPLPDVIVGNLPYSLAAKILLVISLHHPRPRRIACIVQREIAQRISAPPDSTDYSTFSVLMQAHYQIQATVPVHRAAFYPRPHVDSDFVIMEKLPEAATAAAGQFSLSELAPVIRALFASRRATIRKNIQHWGRLSAQTYAALSEQGHVADIPISKRAEQLSVQECLTAAAALKVLGDAEPATAGRRHRK